MFTDLIPRLGTRYPSGAERAAVAEYLSTVPDRLAAYEEMRTHRVAIADGIVEDYRLLYPRFRQSHPMAWEKTARDLQMYNSFAANAMLFDDRAWLDRAWLIWFGTILKSLHFTPRFIEDGMRLWDEQLKVHLSPRSYQLVKPYADHIAGRVSNIPEPHRAEVGERRGLDKRATVGAS